MSTKPRPASTSHAALVAELNAEQRDPHFEPEPQRRSRQPSPPPPVVRKHAPRPGASTSREKALAAAIVDGISEVLPQFIADKIAAAVAPLAERVRQLEERPVPRWAGAFKQDTAYRELSMIVHAGATWIAKTNTSAKPGTDGTWQLCCKSDRQ